MSKKILATNITKSGKKSKSAKVKAGECVPFLHKGNLQKDCVDGINGKWCATEVNEKKQMIKFGFCQEEENSLSLSPNTVSKTVGKTASKTAGNTVSKTIGNNAGNTVGNNASKTSNAKKTKKIIKKGMELNTIPLTIPEGMEDYVRPPDTILKIRNWEMPNRKIFASWFNTNFKKYRSRKTISDIECDDSAVCEIKPTKFELFTHQEIVRDYLNTESPYRGLLIFHGLGVGKTCSSIAVAESFKSDRQVVVILQKSIKQNYISQLKMCGDRYFNHDNNWVFHKADTLKKRNFAKVLGLPLKTYKKLGGWFFINYNKSNNYSSLSKDEKINLEEQIDNMIDSKYEFVHANGITAAQLDKMEEKSFFDNKLVIIDEVHNLINGMASGGSMRALGLEKLFMDAKNLKLVFLSGTPMKNIPFEIGKTFNILRGFIHIDQFEISKKKGKLDFNDLKNLLHSHPRLDQVSIKAKDKIVKITQNPFGFITSADNVGLVKGDNSETGFYIEIKKLLEANDYDIKTHKNYKTTLFPNENKHFMNMFYDRVNNNIIDKNIFKRRIMGMVSFYSSAKKELIPEIKTSEVIKIPMSDYQFDKYSIIRKEEIDRDKKKKTTKTVSKEDAFSVNSSYRAYSRMLCQFVFPEDIPRPFKGDSKDLELDDDILTVLSELKITYERKIRQAKKVEDKEILKSSLKEEERKLKSSSKEYEKRLMETLNTLDRRRDEFLQVVERKDMGLKKYSPKYADIIEKIKKVKGNKFIYTEYKTSEGVGILSISLKANGYAPLKVKKDAEGDFILDINESDKSKPKFALWEGGDESDIILRVFNNLWDTLSDKIQAQLAELGTNNMRGEVLEILLTTKQGAEGLNTKNVRQLFVVEPYWNPVRLDQVIGRAVRIGSHLELPKKDRNVEIYIYLSKATKKQLKANVTMGNDFGGLTSDEVLYQIAEKKRAIMIIMLNMMKQSSIDCSLNLADNLGTNPDLKCLDLGEVSGRDSYSSAPDIVDELKEQEQETRVERVKKTFTTLVYKKDGKQIKVSRSGNKIYDYELVESGTPGQPIGQIVRNATGKEIIKMN